MSEKEEEKLERRRAQLFKSDWSGDGFRALIRDLVRTCTWSQVACCHECGTCQHYNGFTISYLTL